MTRRGLLAIAIGCASVTACVIPPTQSSIGGVTTGAGVGTRVSLGAHAAALDDRGDLPIDLGAGWMMEDVDARGVGHGTYVSLTRRVRGPLWLGGRAEQWWSTEAGQPSRGLVARAAWREHLAGVRWGDNTGGGALGVLGAVATSAYVDVGGRQLDGGGAEIFAAAGVALELPAIAGVSR